MNRNTRMVLLIVAGVIAIGLSMGTVSGATQIESCTTVDNPGEYILSGDLVNVQDNCIDIRANDTVLDGSGYQITGGGGNTTIVASGSNDLSNITVRNFEIDSVRRGIDFGTEPSRNFEKIHIVNNQISNATVEALILEANNSAIRGNVVTDSAPEVTFAVEAGPGGINSDGESLPAYNVTITNNTITSNEAKALGCVCISGLVESNISQNKFSYNTKAGNPGGDVEYLAVANTTISDNVFRSNEESSVGGLVALGLLNTTVSNNQIESTPFGITTARSIGAIIKDNYINNSNSGVILGRTTDTIVENNEITSVETGIIYNSSSFFDGEINQSLTGPVEITQNTVMNSRTGVEIESLNDEYETPTIESNELTGNVRGISINNTSLAVEVLDNNITDNTEGIRATETTSSNLIDVTGNVISDNSGYGILNNDTSVLDATNNYWGSSDGPSGGVADPVTGAIANGSGDRVSASPNNASESNVRFDPFLSSEPETGGNEILTSSGGTTSPNERVTVDFTLTNTGDEPAGYIINIETDIPDAYIRDDDGGTWKPSEQKWAYLNVSPGEQRTPSYTYTMPDSANVGNYTIESEALDSNTRSVVDTADAEIIVQSQDAFLDAIDQNDNCEIDDSEQLRAVDLWQNDQEVPNTGGQTISYTQLLDITDKWSTDATLSYDPAC